jgi:competence transcription factor ComK
MDIEKEIQARVDFKLNEILSAISNQVGLNWALSFEHGSQKHAHYYEAFGKLKEMIMKERQMAVPYNELAERNRKQKRDKAVEKLAERFKIRGSMNYHHDLRAIVSVIEDAQFW